MGRTRENAADRYRHRLPLGGIIPVILVLSGLVLGAWLVLGSPVLLPGAAAQTVTPSPTPQPTVDFVVEDVNEREVHLSDYRGSVVLVNFWATWCSPCKEEMPILDAYYQAYKDAGVVLLGVNVSDRPDEAAAFFEEAGYSFPLAFDPPGNVLIDLGARGLPVSLLVDEDGHLLEKWVGPLTREMLEEAVTPLLAAPSE